MTESTGLLARLKALPVLFPLVGAFHLLMLLIGAFQFAQLDTLGESMLQAGKKKEASEVINQILRMNPPNAEDYRQLLAQIGT